MQSMVGWGKLSDSKVWFATVADSREKIQSRSIQRFNIISRLTFAQTEHQTKNGASFLSSLFFLSIPLHIMTVR